MSVREYDLAARTLIHLLFCFFFSLIDRDDGMPKTCRSKNKANAENNRQKPITSGRQYIVFRFPIESTEYKIVFFFFFRYIGLAIWLMQLRISMRAHTHTFMYTSSIPQLIRVIVTRDEALSRTDIKKYADINKQPSSSSSC